jgi:hypothetical protein
VEVCGPETITVMDADIAADAEALERVRAICRRFPGADEGELQDRPLFRVGRRRFAIFNGATSPPRRRWSSSGRSLHLVTDPVDHDARRHDVRFAPSPHHGERGWVALVLDDLDVVDWDEVAVLLEVAYGHVVPRRMSDVDPPDPSRRQGQTFDEPDPPLEARSSSPRLHDTTAASGRERQSQHRQNGWPAGSR